MPKRSTRSNRRADIAAAGVRLIATGGVRALTHRAIDAELDLPAGSTSYYARTRKDLVALVVQHLAGRTTNDMSGLHLPETLSPACAAAMISDGLNAMMARSTDHLARFALLIEYQDDVGMRTALAGDPPLRPRLVVGTAMLLEKINVEDPATHAADLVTLMDSLLMQLVIKKEPVNVEAVITAYLSGLPKAPSVDTEHPPTGSRRRREGS